MKYIKKFETHSGYETYKEGRNYLTPNVSYCVDLDEVHFQKYIPHDYSKDYLTFVALEDGTFQFTKAGLSYSTDNGDTWTALNANTATPTVNTGNKIMFKGEMIPATTSGNQGIGTFSATGTFNASGNIMSLLYGDNFIAQTDLTGKNYAFYGLFQLNDGLIDASNLILPATTLENYCYSYMFNGCTSLTTAPELPATTLISGCYESMFQDCTSLTTAPELPATTLISGCYRSMFQGCSSLNYIKAMFTTKPTTTYTSNWVSGVSSAGTFVKNSAATWSVNGVYGIPKGWTVQTASA